MIRRRQYRHLKLSGLRSPVASEEKPPEEETLFRELYVELESGQASATFKRKHGSWFCFRADAPVEWMTRIRNMDTIHNWLFDHKHAFRWDRPIIQPPQVERNPPLPVDVL